MSHVNGLGDRRPCSVRVQGMKDHRAQVDIIFRVELRGRDRQTTMESDM